MNVEDDIVDIVEDDASLIDTAIDQKTHLTPPVSPLAASTVERC
jgi:hypothetical protein